MLYNCCCGSICLHARITDFKNPVVPSRVQHCRNFYLKLLLYKKNKQIWSPTTRYDDNPPRCRCRIETVFRRRKNGTITIMGWDEEARINHLDILLLPTPARDVVHPSNVENISGISSSIVRRLVIDSFYEKSKF